MKTFFVMEEKLHATFANFVDLLLDAVCVVDAEGRYIFVSAAFERIFGYAPEEVIGRPMIELVAPQDRERTLQAATEIMSGTHKFDFENRYVRKDGRVVHIRWSARWSEDHKLRMAVAHDISDRKHAESAQAALYAISEAAHAAEDLPGLFKLIHEIIGRLLPAANFSVVMRDEKTGALSFPYEADEYEEDATRRTPAAAAFCAEIIRLGQSRLLSTKSIHELPEQLHVMGSSKAVCWVGVPLKSSKGTIGALILKSYTCYCQYTEQDKELLQFVSTQVLTAIERKQLQERLQFMAQYDELTGLPNRGLLYDRLEQALARAERQQGRIAVLFIDIDNFKQVNDSFGHDAGDILLKEVAMRLKQCVRSYDTVGRMSGDEFVVVLENVLLSGASIVSEQITNAVSEPINVGNRIICIRPSIGIAIYPDHGGDVRKLLKHADEAMYIAKRSGQCRVHIRADG